MGNRYNLKSNVAQAFDFLINDRHVVVVILWCLNDAKIYSALPDNLQDFYVK